MYSTFGVCKAPLAYVVRDDVIPEDETLDLLQNLNSATLPTKYLGSVLNELISQLRHNHPLFHTKDATVYGMLELATQGTVYASTVKPYLRNKDGRSAWKLTVTLYAGSDKWEQLQEDKFKFLSIQYGMDVIIPLKILLAHIRVHMSNFRRLHSMLIFNYLLNILEWDISLIISKIMILIFLLPLAISD